MNPRQAALHGDQKIQKMYGREGCRKEGKNEEEALWALCVCVHACLIAPAHMWPQVDSAPCPLPCASILT